MAATVALGFGVGAATRYSTKHSRSALSPDFFSPFILESKQDISSTCSVLALGSSNAGARLSDQSDLWDGLVWSVEIKQPQLQIARAYTPLPRFASADDVDGESDALRLMVRREASGEMSNYLHRLPEGAIAELRGPIPSFVIPEDVEEVLFLAGGTGIALALQVAHALLKPGQGGDMDSMGPRMRVLWANRRREDCEGAETAVAPNGWLRSIWQTQTQKQNAGSTTTQTVPSPIVRELDHLQARFRGRFRIRYFIDEDNSFITPNIVRGNLKPQGDQDHQRKGKRLVLISGPDGFVAYFAGPKLWQGKRETQGPLAGVLGQIGEKGWTVFKL